MKLPIRHVPWFQFFQIMFFFSQLVFNPMTDPCMVYMVNIEDLLMGSMAHHI